MLSCQPEIILADGNRSAQAGPLHYDQKSASFALPMGLWQNSVRIS